MTHDKTESLDMCIILEQYEL